MDECIDRQKSIGFIDFLLLNDDKLHIVEKATLLAVKKSIEAIPPADVRPVVHSHWKKNDNGTYSCERCHSWIPEEQRHYANWCLYCGADMRGGDAKWESTSFITQE